MAGVLKLFLLSNRKLFWKILRPYINLILCIITTLKTLIFGLFTGFYAKFFFLSNLATLFGYLATLKRVATSSLRTTAIWSKNWLRDWNPLRGKNGQTNEHPICGKNGRMKTPVHFLILKICPFVIVSSGVVFPRCPIRFVVYILFLCSNRQWQIIFMIF